MAEKSSQKRIYGSTLQEKVEVQKQKRCFPGELEVGDCWIGVSLADSSGLMLAARVGKHTELKTTAAQGAGLATRP